MSTLTLYKLKYAFDNVAVFQFDLRPLLSKASPGKMMNSSEFIDRFNIICRVLSNDLPPLHGKNQTYLHTLFILNMEKLPHDFRRHWVINSILDKFKEKQLIRLLKSRNETYDVIRPSKYANTTTLINKALNVNKARNYGISKSLEMGAEWVFILDGGSFLTSESLRSIAKFTRNSSNAQSVYFIPMVRLQYKTNLSMSLTYERLFPFVSGLQEVQIAFSSKYLLERRKTLSEFWGGNSGLVFDETLQYSKREKLNYAEKLKNLMGNDKLFCRRAFIGWQREKSTSARDDMDLIKNCGYVLRLLYHPQKEADNNQKLTAMERSLRRVKSILKFKRTVEKKVKEQKNLL